MKVVHLEQPPHAREIAERQAAIDRGRCRCPFRFYLAIIPTYRLGGAGCDAETNEVMYEPRFSREAR
jgi:hypothetical protein